MVGDFVNFVLSNNHDESNQVEIIYKKQIYRISDSKLSQIRNNVFDTTRYKWVEINFNTWEIKDYGWQISWCKVHIIEYLCAFITFLYMVNNFWRIDVLLWIIHYMKRLYESIYIHKFSAQTMPLKNLYKNTLYYGGAGLILGYLSNIEDLSFKNLVNNTLYYNNVIGLWILCQLGNGYCHYYLSTLRNDDNNNFKHMIPKNYLFQLVCCPNYTFEIMGWLLFALLSTSYNLYFIVKLLFSFIGAYQMYVWSKGKHRRYKKLYENNYCVSKLLIPFFI
jgi:very-long-chain enoyl-CoA reductase